ncbi:MAG TPA: hypothetical protein VN441_17725 [Syntrophomonas sp.]|nr:hypothetical protein [Syntrophomonas sp.]
MERFHTIDTLEMIRRPGIDLSYASDYADLTTLKKLADKHGVAILLIHHLRKQKDADPFNRISGTTGLSGAVDGGFTLVEKRRGSGKATLFCIGRDIEYRELELRRNESNIWELVSDSREDPDLLLPDIVLLVSDFMMNKSEYHGTPGELAVLIAREENQVSGRTISRLLLQSSEELNQRGIRFSARRSNGKRIIDLYSAFTGGDSADSDDAGQYRHY